MAEQAYDLDGSRSSGKIWRSPLGRQGRRSTRGLLAPESTLALQGTDGV